MYRHRVISTEADSFIVCGVERPLYSRAELPPDCAFCPNHIQSPMLDLRPTDALLVIDMQNDFLPGGPLAVPDGDTIIPGINRLTRRFDHVILTEDWHPGGHISFATAHEGKRPFVDTAEAAYGLQTLWPDHCLGGTPGAEIASALEVRSAELILRKGFRKDIDSYSAFFENDKTTGTGLAGFLRERGLTRLFFCGLAFDFCLGNSALDAARLGFEAIVIDDLTRSVGLAPSGDAPGTVEAMESAFAEAQIERLTSIDILGPTAPGRA